ncbi:MAG: hypothetical protein JF590_01685 [Gemmatimonadetes bacterium]|nr:hypothetical protein [Gemmatimonadota bacterium]
MSGAKGLLVSMLALVGVAVPRLAAQSAMQRPGFALGFGLGAGTLDGRCDACSAPGTAVLTPEVTVTFIPNARWQVGGTIAGAVGGAKGYGEHEAALLGTVRIYPTPARPLHLDLSAGHGRYRVSRDLVSGSQELRSGAFAWSVGAGCDLRAGLDLVFVPTISYRRTLASALLLDGTPLTRAGTSVLSFGVALRWRAVPFTPAPESAPR